MAKQIVLSFTSVQTFIGCPLRYKYKYILDIGKKYPNYHATFGSALHEAVAKFAENRHDPLSTQGLVEKFVEKWNQELGDDDIPPDVVQEWMQKGQEVLTQYYQREMEELREETRQPISIEGNFNVRVDPFTNLIGTWDRLDKRDDKIVITEHKTNVKYKRSRLQLKIYAFAYYLQNYQLPDLCEYRSIETGESDPYVPNMVDLEETRAMLLRVADRIREKKFPSYPSKFECKFCLSRHVCKSARC